MCSVKRVLDLRPKQLFCLCIHSRLPLQPVSIPCTGASVSLLQRHHCNLLLSCGPPHSELHSPTPQLSVQVVFSFLLQVWRCPPHTVIVWNSARNKIVHLLLQSKEMKDKSLTSCLGRDNMAQPVPGETPVGVEVSKRVLHYYRNLY